MLDKLPVSYEEWRAAYGLTPERDTSFTTLSGEEIKPLYTERDLPRDAGELDRPAGPVSVYARRVSVDVSGAAVDDAAVRRLRYRRGDQRALPLPA